MKIKINWRIWLEGVADVSGEEKEGESGAEREDRIGRRLQQLVPVTLSLLSPNQLSCLLKTRPVF